MAKRTARARARKGSRKPVRARRAAARSRKTRAKAQRPRGARKSAARRKAARPARRRARRAARRKIARPNTRAAARKTARARPKPSALNRERRRLREEDMVPMPPSTLDFERKSSAAQSGRASMAHERHLHTEGGEALTGGDVDADWSEAYASGEETPGGDMPTPDQDVVEEIGRALGVEYEDAEELKGADKIENRDRHRWEFDPASAEDYKDRNRKQ